ncbi:MAG: GGDEF domain-containing protein [Alistipes sp.]|nr:GGDEF domain-containing protein [Alistipes sp.]
MEKQLESIYELKYKSENYDVVTANAAFYAFLGQRLYYTFDGLLTEASKAKLEEMASGKKYGKLFGMEVFAENGEICRMVCQMIPQELTDQMEIHMIEIERLFDGYCRFLLDSKEKDALLAQYASVYYAYDRASGMVTCYQFDVGKNILSVTETEAFEESIREAVTEEGDEKILKFMMDLRNGTRNFECPLIGRASGKMVLLTGTAVYVDGVHVKTVGHIGNPQVSSSGEVVRRDQLTGLIMKEDITGYARKRIDVSKQKTALIIIDIDNFKNVNDNFGHAQGDEVLRKCAAIIAEQVKGIGKTGRIGGDEFFIVLDKYENEQQLRIILRSIKNSVAAAYSEEVDGFYITTSIGASVYPDNAGDFDTLFHLADYLLYRAKSKGKNRYIIYNLEKHGPVEEIVQSGIKNLGIIGRKGMEKSEVVCKITDMVLCGEGYPLDSILSDVVDYFGVERVVVYDKTDMRVAAQCGNKLLDEEQIADTIEYIADENLEKMYEKGVLVVNNIKAFEEKNGQIYEKLCRQGVLSLMHHRITAKSGKTFVISYESVVIRNTWNLEDMHFFRILDRILEQCL